VRVDRLEVLDVDDVAADACVGVQGPFGFVQGGACI
jgi:hypothetical protein